MQCHCVSRVVCLLQVKDGTVLNDMSQSMNSLASKVCTASDYLCCGIKCTHMKPTPGNKTVQCYTIHLSGHVITIAPCSIITRRVPV